MNSSNCNVGLIGGLENNKNSFSIFFIVLFIVEFIFLRTYVLREIFATIPPDVDSSVYLNDCYYLYECIYNDRWNSVLSFLTHLSNGGLVIIRTAILFLTGYSRSSIILLNEFVFILMQITGIYVFGQIGRKCALYFYGLTIAENVLYVWSGDITSARFEFITFCLYGIWVLTSIYFIMCKSKLWGAISGVCAGVVVFCRFFSALIISIVIILFVIVLLFIKKNVKRTFKYVLKYALFAILGGGWLLLINLKSFLGYYFAAFNGPQSSSWQIKMDMIGNIKYSIDYIVFSLGKPILVILVLLAIASVLCLLCNHRKYRLKFWELMFAFISIFVPVIIFTFMSNKQGLVYSICNIPIIAFVVLLTSHSDLKIFSFLSVLVLFICSTLFLIKISSKHNVNSLVDVREEYQVNEAIVEYMKRNDVEELSVLFDRFVDTHCVNTIQLIAYEEGEGTKSIRYAIDCINENLTTSTFSDKEYQEAISTADVVVFNEFGYNNESPYLTNQLLDSYRKEMCEYSYNNLDLIFEGKSGIKVFAKRGKL